ncbi:hypothetical protein C8R45DRAFT_1105132 [Mycena sanguinolenta]|nr:hypothetical protein C8R45DRAFT_1105132 [Mycena sanguinolenta]
MFDPGSSPPRLLAWLAICEGRRIHVVGRTIRVSSAFTGLKTLHTYRILFTQARVDILFRLPNLSKLYLLQCPVPPEEHVQLSPQELHLSHFYFNHSAEREHEQGYWILLLHPDHLRVLSMRFSGGSVHTIPSLHAIPSFPNVHTFSANLDHLAPPQKLAILSKFPGVRVLELWNGLDNVGHAAQAGAIFPQLREYCGSCEALSLFVAATTLRRIQTYFSEPEDFLAPIRAIQGLEITSLNLTELLLTITVSNMYSLFEHKIYDNKLPEGEVLDGRYGDYIRSGFTVLTFFLKLADATFLPFGLERLAINWECIDRKFREFFCTYKIPDFPHMRDEFVARCPDLTWLWLGGIYFMFESRSLPDGTVKEYFGKKYKDVSGRWEDAAIFRESDYFI